ncbi:MAG: SDR family oxidoreductase [Alphaproteobacteria bacterium]|nr:SDR family oxidoreductase [Alphaproteobacteria bacterium]
MDLGIKGRKAIVCASSQGLGKGCAMALAREGCEVVINARTASALEATAAEIRAATGAKVTVVAADVTTPEGRAALLAACPAPDILVNNAGGPPIGDFRDWDEAAWQKAVNDNMVTPIMLIKAVVDGMIARKWGRIVNITSRSVKAPLPHLGLSNGARAGLTGFVAGLARQVARHNVVINNLLPGPFMTERQADGLRKLSAKAGQDFDSFKKAREAEVPAGRFGTPEEFGKACAFLCSADIGFVVGQNLVIDGGAVNVTM